MCVCLVCVLSVCVCVCVCADKNDGTKVGGGMALCDTFSGASMTIHVTDNVAKLGLKYLRLIRLHIVC